MDESFRQVLERPGRPTVCVVGDLMLDVYVWGGVSRVSPEGPIPVLRVEQREQRPGGSGSVTAMLAALGARVLPVGVIGDDSAGQALRAALEETAVDTAGLIALSDRPTTTKTRYLGYVQSAGRAMQQLLRVDEEDTHPLAGDEAEAVRRAAERCMAGADLLVFQDMGKGLFDDALAKELIEGAVEAGKPVLVDPERSEDYSRYAGATCIVPNRFEAELATGLRLREEADYERVAGKLLDDLSLKAIVIKLDREGIYYATADGGRGHVTTQAREVADVTGAGDMVTAAFSLALASGQPYGTAAAFANFAAGLEVAHRGATALSRQEVLEAVEAQMDPVSRKIVPRRQVEALVARLHNAGKRIAFTNGCFDLLHLGHIQLLRDARAHGDVLIVGLNSDASARELKGPGRPINSEQVRSRVIAALGDVDYVVLFDEPSVLPLIEQVRPDVLVKGGDYTKEGVVGHEFVESYGGQVKLAPVVEGLSTTDLIERIARNHEEQD